MAAMFFYGWLIIALVIFVCILWSLHRDRRIREEAEAVKTMIRESERRD